MSYRQVEVGVAEGVGTLTLDQPDRLNAFDIAMSEEMVEASQALVKDPAVRVVVLTGAGRAFCAGADVRFLGSSLGGRRYDEALTIVRNGNAMVRLLHEAPMPVVASLNGPAVGGGMSLALACDLRVASEQATLGMAFHRIGVHPDLGVTYFLPRLVGPARALDLIWSTEMLGAARCLELGLVDRVVPHPELGAETQRLAARLAALPGPASALAKAAVRENAGGDLAAALARELEHQGRSFRSYDAAEGTAAFLSKRAPRFRGH
jgi:2-(1,2-epoxy-1,2-dihydrophenyl)acetyl-CoA isomerase